MRCMAFFVGMLAWNSAAMAQMNIIEKAIDDLFDHYFMLDPGLDVALGGDQAQVDAALGVSLQKPDVTPRSFAEGLSPSVGLMADVVDSATWAGGIGMGARGTLDFDQPFFQGGLLADTGAWGLTPTVVNQLWVGDQRMGVLIESEFGIWGPRQGWRGSANVGLDFLGGSTQGSAGGAGMSDFLLGASVSFVDETYLQANYQENDGIGFLWAPEAWSVGALWTYNLGGNVRLSVPVEYQRYLGAAADYYQDPGPAALSAGLSLGYRFD